MKKSVTLILLLLHSVLGNSQKQTIKLKEDKINNLLYCEYVEKIDLDKADTTYYVSIGFKNKEYSTIVDAGSIVLTTQVELEEFKKDFNLAYDQMDDRVNISWDRKRYALNLHDFSDKIFLEQPKTEIQKYTEIDKDESKDLIDWLSDIKIGAKPIISKEKTEENSIKDSLLRNGRIYYKNAESLEREFDDLTSSKEKKEKLKEIKSEYLKAQPFLEQYATYDKKNGEVYMMLIIIYRKTDQNKTPFVK